MASLRDLTAQFPALVIDAASSLVQVGWLTPDGAAKWQTSSSEAGIGMFEAIHKLGANPTAAEVFVFCEGPGSILGVRTAAMAIRTWCVLKARPVFAYSSLGLVAHALADPGSTVIADARRDSWHAMQLGGGLRRLPTASLSGALVMPDGFRHWTPLPTGVRFTPYRVDELLREAPDADLFHATASPDAFLHEEPRYAGWTPQVHRGKSQPDADAEAHT